MDAGLDDLDTIDRDAEGMCVCTFVRTEKHRQVVHSDNSSRCILQQ